MLCVLHARYCDLVIEQISTCLCIFAIVTHYWLFSDTADNQYVSHWTILSQSQMADFILTGKQIEAKKLYF